jgi:enoyl-CoA hydratase
MDRPPVNAMTPRMHAEMAEIWRTVDRDPNVRVVLVTGAGRVFSAGGDIALEEEALNDIDARLRSMREATDIVYGMVNLDKPIVSAINGPAVGAGLAVALLADVSIIA